MYSVGFLCPVHTPDGAPCGLLNHLAAACQVCNYTVYMYMYRMPTFEGQNSVHCTVISEFCTLGFFTHGWYQ